MPMPPKTPEPELKFQPVTEGLGFHPFSDGLPYAPVVKTQTSRTSSAVAAAAATSGASASPQLGEGLGATAAGKPVFAAPPRPAAGATSAGPAKPLPPRISVPVAPQAQMRRPAPVQPQVVQAKTQHQQQQAAQALADARPAGTLDLAPRRGVGYLLKRAFAYLLDTAFNLALCAGALSLALWKQDMSPELLLTPGIVLVATLFLAVFNWAITTAQEVAFGTSVGKRVFGLALDGGTSAIFLRAFFFLPSLCFGGLGLLWALFDKRKRCWHDLVVDLQPIEIARL